MLVELLEGNRVVRTTQTDLNGRYQFTGLQQGTYEVRGTAPVHGVALRQVPLTPGAAVVVHFVVIPRKPLGIYASLAGTAVDPAVEINPDLDGSGMVDFEDLLVTHPHLGQPPAEFAGDVNSDGSIDGEDVHGSALSSVVRS